MRVEEDLSPEMEEEEGFELVGEDELVEDEEKITLSPEEFQQLKSKGDSASALQQGIAQLGEVLNKKEKPVQRDDDVPQMPGESWEDFKKGMSERLFGDQTGDVLEEFVNRKLAPIIDQIGGVTAEQSKELLRVSPDTGKYFEKYREDIEEFHQRLPKVQRNNPKSWKYSYDEVLKTKIEDIADDRAKEKFEEMFAAKMAEMGMEAPSGKVGGGTRTFGEGGGVVGTGAAKKKKQVTYSPELKREWEVKFGGENGGLSFEDFLEAKGVIK